MPPVPPPGDGADLGWTINEGFPLRPTVTSLTGPPGPWEQAVGRFTGVIVLGLFILFAGALWYMVFEFDPRTTGPFRCAVLGFPEVVEVAGETFCQRLRDGSDELVRLAELERRLGR